MDSDPNDRDPTTARTRANAPAPGHATVRLHYPPGPGDLHVRLDRDWDRPVAPTRAARALGFCDFVLPLAGRHAYFKPVLQDESGVRWAAGPDRLVLPGQHLDVHPHFAPASADGDLEEHVIAGPHGGRAHRVAVLLPPGYGERALAVFPVLYMHDGQNLFSPERAFAGQHWQVAEALRHLRAMGAAAECIVVGIEPRDRDADYTAPGYEAYGEFLVRTLKPWVDARFRTLRGAAHTATMGASLGGVVSMHLGLRYPDVFGQVACMSSTFGYRDDLDTRLDAGRRPARVYLDSGWPRDNYEVTRTMAQRLRALGLRDGRELLYLAFPHARHSEAAWAARLHLPLQFLWAESAAHPRVRALSAMSFDCRDADLAVSERHGRPPSNEAA